MIAIQGTFSGMLCFKDSETSIVVGDTLDTFAARALHNDGCISPNTVLPYQNGVIWAGHRGIYYYDGASIINLIENTLGDWYTKTYDDIDSGTYNTQAFIHRDHYFISFESNNMYKFKDRIFN